MEELDTLSDRVIKLETEVTGMKVNMAVFNQIIKESIEVQKELSATIKDFGCAITDIKMALLKMQNELTNNTNGMILIQSKIGEVEKSIKSTDDKSKVDVVVYLRDHWVQILLGAGFIATLLHHYGII